MADSKFYSSIEPGKHQGKAYIITVEPADPSLDPRHRQTPAWTKHPRPFAEKDEHRLYVTLGNFGYTVKLLCAKNLDDLQKHLKEAQEVDYSKYDSLLIFISGYGREDTVLCTGGQLPLKEYVQNLFKADQNKCPTLAGKPKVVVLQLCDLEMYPFKGREEAEDGWVAQAAHMPTHTLPTVADFYFCVSNIPGRAAEVIKVNGSPFLSNLCRILDECPPDGQDMKDIFMKADYDTGEIPCRNLEKCSLFIEKLCHILETNELFPLDINKVFTRLRGLLNNELETNEVTKSVYAQTNQKLPAAEGTLTRLFNLTRN